MPIMPLKVLFTTVYKNDPEPYDYIGSNARSKWFRFYWPRLQSFGLRFLKQNIPEIEILEYPTFEEYKKKLAEGWDVVGFCLPMAFLINQVYVLYFNSKPANISYLSNMYSTGESFKFGMTQLVIILVVLTLWTPYVMPLMGFQSRLW